MNKLKPFILGILGVAVGAVIAIYLGEANPPNGVHLVGLFIGSISLFYLVIVSVVRFTLYMMRLLGWIPNN